MPKLQLMPQLRGLGQGQLPGTRRDLSGMRCPPRKQRVRHRQVISLVPVELRPPQLVVWLLLARRKPSSSNLDCGMEVRYRVEWSSVEVCKSQGIKLGSEFVAYYIINW